MTQSMISSVEGANYNLEIISQREDRDYCFFIRAVSKSSRRTSCINNLNAILSEFGVDGNDSKIADSIWVVTKEDARHLEEAAKRFLSDPSFLDYLEKQLDKDRVLGEWENVISDSLSEKSKG